MERRFKGIAGRQVPGQPLPDHGKQQYDTDTFYDFIAKLNRQASLSGCGEG